MTSDICIVSDESLFFNAFLERENERMLPSHGVRYKALDTIYGIIAAISQHWNI